MQTLFQDTTSRPDQHRVNEGLTQQSEDWSRTLPVIRRYFDQDFHDVFAHHCGTTDGGVRGRLPSQIIQCGTLRFAVLSLVISSVPAGEHGSAKCNPLDEMTMFLTRVLLSVVHILLIEQRNGACIGDVTKHLDHGLQVLLRLGPEGLPVIVNETELSTKKEASETDTQSVLNQRQTLSTECRVIGISSSLILRSQAIRYSFSGSMNGLSQSKIWDMLKGEFLETLSL
ncbi:hypothetical protein BDZ45DRAFT_698340 [Acephala macrosclerotiorum]|nr:hypothetical protein BDZ45DRAFT_698340 [Acephala macrosclerotiorum]